MPVPLKIGLLYPLWYDFPPRKAEYAMDVVGKELSSGLAKLGHRVEVLSRSRDVTSGREWLFGSSSGAAGYRTVRLPRLADAVTRRLLAIRAKLRRGPQSSPGFGDSSSQHRLGYGLPAAVRSRIDGCDVVHVCVFDELVPVVRSVNPSAKIVLHMHDHKQAFRDKGRTDRNLGRADAIVGCSEFITDAVRRRFPHLAPRCRTIRNAFDPSIYAPASRGSNDRTRIVFVGRLSPEKGVHTILEAFAPVHERHPETTLRLVGQNALAPLREADPSGADARFDGLRDFYRRPGSYARHLRGLIPSRSRGDVEFVDSVDHSETAGYFADADICVFPSIWDEPFGLPIIEAMGSGLPVVATRVGGIPETVANGETGILVLPDDSRALADALLSLLDDDALRRRMGAAGRRRAVNLFGWERRLDEWDSLYRSLVGAAA